MKPPHNILVKISGSRARIATGIRAAMSLIMALAVLTQVSVASAATVTNQSQSTGDQNGVYQEQVPYFDTTYPSCSAAGFSSSSGSGNATVTTDLASFIDAYGQAAFDVGKSSGIPYDAILAQASLESNNGQSELNKQAFNFFGMKAGSSWTGPTVTMRTAEQDANGNVYYVDAKFRAYPNAQAGFQGYVDFLKSLPIYSNVFNFQHDPVGYFQALKNDGYATDVSYVDKLTSKLNAVQQYIAKKNLFPPSSQVVYDVPPSGGGTTPPAGSGSTATTGSGGGGGSCGSGSSATSTGNASGIAAVALAEIGNHYQKYTNGRVENWCADFVSWVYKQAGEPFKPTPGVAMVDGWQIPAVQGVWDYLKANGQFFPKSATAPPPQVGDIIIYKNGMSHTNIVVEANGYMVKTVGGNQESYDETQSVVSESKGAFDIRNDSTVTGWGRLP